jgi:hypothetical protein
MTTQQNFNFDNTEGEGTMQKKKLRRCPRCKRMPKNIADSNIGYAYSCLCRCAMLGRFSIYEETAIDDWNHCVERQQQKMEHIIPRKRKRTNPKL